MSQSLVIVESPAKAKTIKHYLGKDFTVKASVGHFRDLPKKGLGVDLDDQFKPTYEISPGKEKIVRELKSAARGVNLIYIATDPDREGEAIGWHLSEILSGKKKTFYRVLFNEITKKAIQQAFKNPGEINYKLVESQQARRILDRIVGYKVSSLLWEKVRRGISAGRVQTVALRLIAEREREINAFQPEESWTLTAKLHGSHPPSFDALLQKIDCKTIKLKTKEQIEGIIRDLGKSSFLVENIITKEKKRNLLPPFITSKLQQDAARKLKFTVKKTMHIAQQLHAGIELGKEGSVGLITYMRTDSLRVSDDALEEVRAFIGQKYGMQYLPEKPNFYRSRKDAQDAHEAIRPTSARHPDELKLFLNGDQLKLYKLIWQRFVASQMKPALFEQTLIEISAGRYFFKTSGSVLKFDGAQKVYQQGRDEKDANDDNRSNLLPKLQKGDIAKLEQFSPEQHFTQPPARFTEATLVKILEEKGIGRPSTYSSILTTIQEREYALQESGKFTPTELGLIVNDLLVDSFTDIFDIQYTARMEEELDDIGEGKLLWNKALETFYKKFQLDLQRAHKNMRDIKKMEEPTGDNCEKCGQPMVIKWGRHGKFVACSGYPDCKNTRELDSKAEKTTNAETENQTIEEICEKCGKPMAMKRGRFGQFLACTGYPNCKTTKRLISSGTEKISISDIQLKESCPNCGESLVIKHGRFGEFTACSNYPKCKYVKKKTLGISCPEQSCDGEIVEKKSRRGKLFYGCDQYPNCEFSVWNKPINEPCPNCESEFVLEKITKKQGLIHFCNTETCDYQKILEVPVK